MGTVKHGAFNSSKIDTTGFFESNTNLWKALALFYKLKDGSFLINILEMTEVDQSIDVAEMFK